MGDIINLNQYRKARSRQDAARRADANRRRYGRTKSEREKEAQDRALAERRHEQLRLEGAGEPETGPKDPPKSA